MYVGDLYGISIDVSIIYSLRKLRWQRRAGKNCLISNFEMVGKENPYVMMTIYEVKWNKS
jgi:hypothetical protein